MASISDQTAICLTKMLTISMCVMASSLDLSLSFNRSSLCALMYTKIPPINSTPTMTISVYMCVIHYFSCMNFYKSGK